eukprot:m.82123 g.82123  ORF g.82123 m.82123 type:complete len:330 (+) comp14600_c0_seq2:100-1089(+)
MVARRFNSTLVVSFAVCLVIIGYSYIQQTHSQMQVADLLHKNAQLNAMVQPILEKQAVESHLKPLFLITPTHQRLTQQADLISMCQTLKHVPKLHWIVIEDSLSLSAMVRRVLDTCKLNFTHTRAVTPADMRPKLCQVEDPTRGCPPGSVGKIEEAWRHPRGVVQRNQGLTVLRELATKNNIAQGVVYFADDDNRYALELFDVIRQVKVAGAWRVGLVGDMLYEGPITNTNNDVVDWHVGWRPERAFPIDMAGFAVGLAAILSRPGLQFDANAPRGHLESYFLSQLLPRKEAIEAFGMTLDHVLVWHTRTEKPRLKWERKVPSDTSIQV